MKRDREDLENLVEESITDIHISKRINKEVRILAESKLAKWFYKQKIIQILNKNCPISTLSNNELYNLALFLKDVNKLKVDLDEYYSSDEMTEAVNDKITITKDYSRSVTFSNMVSNRNEIKPQWVGFISYQDIGMMFEGGAFDYNFATQRKARIVKIGNRTHRIATINEKNVTEIEQEVLNNKFEENAITLNIRISDGEEYAYHESSSELVVDRTKTTIDVIDGYHRINGIYRAWKKDKNISGGMILVVKHLDINQARYFIQQEAKGTLNNADDLKTYDSSTNVAKLVNSINRYSVQGNILSNAISSGCDEEHTLVYYDVFAGVMTTVWGVKLETTKNSELIRIKEFICEFYSLIYDYFCEKSEVKDIQDLEWLAKDQMFIAGLLYPAYDLYKEDQNINIDRVQEVAEKLYIKIKNEDRKFTYSDDKNISEMEMYSNAWKKVVG